MSFRTVRRMLRPLSGACVVLLLAVGCSSGTAKGPSASVAAPSTTERPTTTTAKALTPEQEVEAAYLKSWDVYAKAMRNVDTSHLADVYAGDALQMRTEEINDLARLNRAGQIRVSHDYSISVFDNGNRALVIDAYSNHSVLIDSQSGNPLESDPNNVVKRQYELRYLEGTWKVVYVKALH